MGPLAKIRGNRLIAEFMGVETCTDKHDDGPCYFAPTGAFGKFEYVKDYSLKYDQRYDWLMPVVNKCIKIYHTDRQDIFSALTSGDGIDKLFIAVVKFIEWYNDPEKPWCVAIGYPAPEHKKHTT